MNTYIFLYPNTSFFEVTLAAYFMKTKGSVYIVAEEEHQVICTNEGIKPHCLLCQASSASV